jgi:hypothetical protein
MDHKRDFCVEFSQDLVLEFQAYDTPLAQRWYDLLCEVLRDDPSLREDDRLHDFPSSNWTESAVIDRINGCVDVINSQQTLIPERAVLGGSRQQLNQLHKRFEELRGGILAPGQQWQQADDGMRAAINDLNIQIHRLEDILDSRNNPEPWPHMVITFNNFQRRPLLPEDYRSFTTDTRFGEVYVNYCEVGKALWNVYFDGDDVVGDDNIRPLRYYSPEMVIKFYDATQDGELPKFWAWWDANCEHLAQLGFQKSDPDLSIGAIPVARLKNHWNRRDLINAISGYDRVQRVYIP